jgi:hypothetical protein
MSPSRHSFIVMRRLRHPVVSVHAIADASGSKITMCLRLRSVTWRAYAVDANALTVDFNCVAVDLRRPTSYLSEGRSR